jgi:hypothetical protein
LKKIFCLAFFMVFVASGAAFAQSQTTLSDEQVKERLGFVENALSLAQPAAKTWWYGWISAYSAGAVVQGILAGAHWNDVKVVEDAQGSRKVRDRGFAEDMLVGGVTCALGAGNLLVNPFLPAYGPNKLRSLPEDMPAERLMKLQKAEELLRQCARREEEGRGWLTHLLNLGVNAVAGVVTAAAFRRPWYDGVITFATNEAVSLLNIYTQPRRAVRDLENYEIRYLGRRGAPQREPSGGTWFFSIVPGGFSVGARF